MNYIESIENYIVYLISECGLSVTLHPLKNETLITFTRLIRFNIHDNSYCTYIKSSPKGHERCLAHQKKVLEKCRTEEKEFCGICYAGVFEHVYPIFDGTEIIGFISVGAYACEAGEKRVKCASRLTEKTEIIATKAYSALRSELPDKKKIDTLIFPLCSMLELAYRNLVRPEKESLIVEICRYVQQHYSTDLTTEEICRVFYCSRSYFSHAFKKEVGTGFREYLTQIRIDHAKRLLRYSNLSVTEIAVSVGFADSNYFSNVFKKQIGCSPLAYRKK